jgi:hypothetical protein
MKGRTPVAQQDHASRGNAGQTGLLESARLINARPRSQIRLPNVRSKAAPIMYSRVVRALTAIGEEPQHLESTHSLRIAESLNREFQKLGIQVRPADVRGRRSASEIAEVINEKIIA